MKTRAVLSVVSLTLILCACDNNAKVAPLEARVTALEAELQELKRLSSTEKMLRSFDEVAYLTPGASGYAVIKSDLGPLTVLLANIEPYASGSKVTLQFGNLG